MLHCGDLYLLIPSQWDPHTTVYAENEGNMVDWKGNIIEPKYRKRIILQEEKDSKEMHLSSVITTVEKLAVSKAINETNIFEINAVNRAFPSVPKECDQGNSVLNSICPTLNDDTLLQRIEEQADLGIFAMEVCSTIAHDENTVLDEPTEKLTNN